MPALSRTVGHYRLLAPLGQGAHGTVYQAEQTGPGHLVRTVALKVLKPGATGLWHEARLGGLLRHPHLVDVYEVGEADGQVFCAMEWCEGGPLTRWAPLPPQAVVDAGLQACAALGYAHEQLGIVHLDLKPANLFLGRDGVKVGDWGIARPQGTGPISGTRGFMAPEQREGRPVDARTDVYALGVTLVHLATTPSDGDAPYTPRLGAPSTVYLTEGPVDGGTTLQEAPVPAWLRDVVARCVAPDPADRWPSMAALAHALGQLEVDGPGLDALLDQPVPPAPPEVALFGRDTLLVQVEARLTVPRALVTLRGAPGVGKSHLARALVQRARARGDTVVVCDLDGVDALDVAMGQLARSVDLPVASDDLDAQLERLQHVLQGMGRVLVVFDNVGPDLEQPEALGAWDPGPEVRFLITSRHPLRLPAEVVVDVPPLPLDACHALFWATARGRGVREVPHPGLPSLFERLDRLPLAIELVAGRLGVLTLDEVLANTELGFLRSSRRGRHATLHTALALSWSLLSVAERQALERLAAFRGAVPMPAIEAVLAPLGDPLMLLAGLTERSLLRADGNRFAVLSTVRDYVAELGTTRAAAEEAHGAFFAAFGSAGEEAALWAHGGHHHLELLAASHDDVWLACERALERHDAATAVACLQAWWAVGALRGPFLRGVALAEAVRARAPLSPPQAAAITTVLGHAQRLTGALADAEASLGHALALAEAHDLPRIGLQAAIALSGALVSLSRRADAYAVLERWVTAADGRVPTGLLAVGLAQWGALGGHPGDARTERLGRAVALARSSGHRRPEGMALQVLGALDHMAERTDRAERRYRAALRVFETTGDRRFIAIVSANLAVLLGARHDREAALEALNDALRACLEMGDRRQEIVVRIAIGEVHIEHGDGEAALPPLHKAQALALELGITQRAGVAALDLARAWALRGDVRRAEAALDRAKATPTVDPVEYLATAADVAWFLDRPAEARRLFHRAKAQAEPRHAEYLARVEGRLTRER